MPIDFRGRPLKFDKWDQDELREAWIRDLKNTLAPADECRNQPPNRRFDQMRDILKNGRERTNSEIARQMGLSNTQTRTIGRNMGDELVRDSISVHGQPIDTWRLRNGRA